MEILVASHMSQRDLWTVTYCLTQGHKDKLNHFIVIHYIVCNIWVIFFMEKLVFSRPFTNNSTSVRFGLCTTFLYLDFQCK